MGAGGEVGGGGAREDLAPDIAVVVLADAIEAGEATVGAPVRVELELVHAVDRDTDRDRVVEGDVGVGAAAGVLVGHAGGGLELLGAV